MPSTNTTTNKKNNNSMAMNAMVVPADLSLSDWYPLASQVLEALSSYRNDDDKSLRGISPPPPNATSSVRSMPWSGHRSHLRSAATAHEVDHQAIYTKRQFVSQLGPVLMEARLEVLLEQSGKAIERANIAATSHMAAGVGGGSVGGGVVASSLDQSQSVHRHPGLATSQSTTTALSASYQHHHDSDTSPHAGPSPAPLVVSGGGGGGFVLADFLQQQQPDKASGGDATPSSMMATTRHLGATTPSVSTNTVLVVKHDQSDTTTTKRGDTMPSSKQQKHPDDGDVSHIFYQQHTITSPSDVVLWSTALLSLVSSRKNGARGGIMVPQSVAPTLPTSPPLLDSNNRGDDSSGSLSSTTSHIIMHPTLKDALNSAAGSAVMGGGGSSFGGMCTPMGGYSTVPGSSRHHQNRGGSPFDQQRRRTRQASFSRMSNESPPKRQGSGGGTNVNKDDDSFKFYRAIPAGEHASPSSVVARRAVVSPVRRHGSPTNNKVVEDPLTVALREAEESVFNAATSGLKKWHQSISPTRRHRSPNNNTHNSPLGGTSPPRTAGLGFNSRGSCISPFDTSVAATNMRPSTASENLGLKAASAYLQHFHLQYVATTRGGDGCGCQQQPQPPLPATLLSQLELIASQPLSTSTLGGRLTPAMVAVEQGDLMMKALWRARRDANKRREEAAEGGCYSGGGGGGGRRLSTTSGDTNSRGGSPRLLRERRRSFETTSAAIAEMHHIDQFLEVLGDSVLSFQLQVESMLSNFYDVCVREARRRFSQSSSTTTPDTTTTTSITPPTYGSFMSVLVDIVAEELRMQRLFPSSELHNNNNNTSSDENNNKYTIKHNNNNDGKSTTTPSVDNTPDSTDMIDVHPVPEAAISYAASPCLLSTHIEGHPRGRSLWDVSQPKAISAVHVSEDLCLTLHRASNQTYAEQHGSNISNSVVYAAEVAESMGGGAQGGGASSVRAAGGGRSFILHLRTPQALAGVDRCSQTVQLAHQGVLSFRLSLHLSAPTTTSYNEPSTNTNNTTTTSSSSSMAEGSSTHVVAATLSRINGVVCIATRDCLYFFDIYKEPRGEVIKRLMASEYNNNNNNNTSSTTSSTSNPTSPPKQRRGDGGQSSFPELQCIAVLPIDSPRAILASSDNNTAVSISCMLLREEMLPPTDNTKTQKKSSSKKEKSSKPHSNDHQHEEDGGDDGDEMGDVGVRKASKGEAMPGHLVRSTGWINNVCLLVGSSGGQLSVVRPPVWHAAVGSWIPPCFFSSTRLGESALRGSQQPQQQQHTTQPSQQHQQLEASVQMLQQETIVSLRPMERGDGYAPSVIFALTTRGSVYAVNVVEGSPCHVGIVASYNTTSSIPTPLKNNNPIHNDISGGAVLSVMMPPTTTLQQHHQGTEKSLVIKAVLACPRYGMQHVNDVCANDPSDYVVCVGSASFLLVWVAPGRQRRARLNNHSKGGVTSGTTDGHQHPTFGLVVEPRKIDDIHNPHYPQVTRVNSVGTLEGVVSLDAIGTVKWWNLRSLCCLWTIRVGELNAIPPGSNLKVSGGGGVGNAGGGGGVGAGLNRARSQAKNMFKGSEGGGATLTTSAVSTNEGRRDANESSPLTNALDFTCTNKRLVVVTQRGLLSFLVKGEHLGKQDTTGAVAMPPTSLGIRLRLPQQQEYRSLHASTGTIITTTLSSAPTTSTHLLSSWADVGDVCALAGISSLFPRGVLMAWRGRQQLFDTPTSGNLSNSSTNNTTTATMHPPRAILGQFVTSVLYDLHITTTPQYQQLLMGIHNKRSDKQKGSSSSRNVAVNRRKAKRVFYVPSVEFRPERGGSDTSNMGATGARAGEGGSIGVVTLPIQNIQPSATTIIIDWVHTGPYFALLMSSGDVRVHAAIVGGSDGGGGGLVFVFTHEDLVAAACESCSVVGMSTVQDTFLTSSNTTHNENNANTTADGGADVDGGVSEDLHDLDEIGCGITYCPLWNRLVVPTRGSWIWFLPLSMVDSARWGSTTTTTTNNAEEEERKELCAASSSEEDDAEVLGRLSKSKGDARRDRTERLYGEHREHMKKYKEVLEADGWGNDEDISRTMVALNGYSDLDDDDDSLLLNQGGGPSAADRSGGHSTTTNKGWRVARDKRLKREAKIREHKENGGGATSSSTTTNTATTSTWGGGQYEDGVPRISVVRGGGYSLFGPFLPDEVAVVRLQGTLTFPSFMYFHASTTTTAGNNNASGDEDDDHHEGDDATPRHPSALQLRAASSLSSHTVSSATNSTTNRGGLTHRPHHHRQTTTIGRGAPLRTTDPSRGGNSSSGGAPSTPDGMGLDIPLPMGVGGGSPHVRPSFTECRTNCSSAVTHAPYIMSAGSGGSTTAASPSSSSVAVVTPRYFIGAVDGAVEVFVLQGSTVAGGGNTRQKRANITSKKTSRRQHQQHDDDSSSQIDCRSVVSGVSSMNPPTSSRQLVKQQPFGAFLGPTNSRLTPIPSQGVGGVGGGTPRVGRHPSDLIPHHRNNSSTNLIKTSTRSSVISLGTPLESRTGSMLMHGNLSHLSSGAFGGRLPYGDGGGNNNAATANSGSKGPHVPISLFVGGRPAILQHIQRIIVSTLPLHPHPLLASPFMSGGGNLHHNNNSNPHGGGGGSSSSFFGPSSLRRSWWNKTPGSMPLSTTTTTTSSDDIATINTDLKKEVIRITQQQQQHLHGHGYDEDKVTATSTPATTLLLSSSTMIKSTSTSKPSSNNDVEFGSTLPEEDPEIEKARKAAVLKEAVGCCVESRCKKATLTPAEEPASSSSYHQQQHQSPPPRSAATLITCLSFIDPFVLVCSFDGAVRVYLTRHNTSSTNPSSASFTTTSANNLVPSASIGGVGGAASSDDALPPDVRSTLHYTFTARDLYPMHLEIELDRCRRAMGALQRARSMFAARGSTTTTTSRATSASTPVDGGSGCLSPEEADGLPEKDKRSIEDGYRAIMAGIVGSSTTTTSSSSSSDASTTERDYGGLALWRQAAIRLQCRYDTWTRATSTVHHQQQQQYQQPASTTSATPLTSSRTPINSTVPHYITCATAVTRPSRTTALRPSEQPCPLESEDPSTTSSSPANRSSHNGGSIVVALGDCWGFVSLVLLRLPPTPTTSAALPTPSSNLGSMLPIPTTSSPSSNSSHHHLSNVLDTALHGALLGPDTTTRLSQPGALAARGGVLLLDRWLAHPVVEEQRRPLTHFDEQHASTFLMSINPFIYYSDRASLLRTDNDDQQQAHGTALVPSRSAAVAAGRVPSMQAHQRRRMSRFAGAEGIVVERKVGVQQGWINEAQGRWLAGEHLCASLTDVAGACILGGPSTVTSRYPGDTRPKAQLKEFIRTTYETVRGLPVWCGGTCEDPVAGAREIMAAAAERIGSGVNPVEAERKRQQWMQRSLQVLKALGTIHKVTVATTTVYTGFRSSSNTATSSSFFGGFSDSTNMSESYQPQQASQLGGEDEEEEGEMEQEGDTSLQYAHTSHVSHKYQNTPPTLLAGVGVRQRGGSEKTTTSDDTTTSTAPSAFAPTKLPTFREIHNFWEDLQPTPQPTAATITGGVSSGGTLHTSLPPRYSTTAAGTTSSPLSPTTTTTATDATPTTTTGANAHSYRWMLQYERRLGVLAIVQKEDSVVSSGCRGEFDATEPVSVWSLGGYYKSSLWEAGRLGEQHHQQTTKPSEETSAAAMAVDAHLGVVLQALSTRHQAWSTVTEKYTAPPSSLRTLKRRAAKAATTTAGSSNNATAMSTSMGQSSRLAAVGFDPERKFAQSDLFLLFERSMEPTDDSENNSSGVGDSGALLSTMRAIAHQAAIKEEVGYILQETMAACTHLMMLSCKGGAGRWQHQHNNTSSPSPSSALLLSNHLSSQLLSHFSTSIVGGGSIGNTGVSGGGGGGGVSNRLGMGGSWVPPSAVLSASTIHGMVLHPPPWYLCDPFSLLTTSLHTNQPPLLYFGQCLSEGGMNSGGGAATSAEEEDPPLWRWDTSIHYAMFTNTPPHGGGSGGSHTHTSATIDSMVVPSSIVSRIASKVLLSSSSSHHHHHNTAPPIASNNSTLLPSEAVAIRASTQGFYSWLQGDQHDVTTTTTTTTNDGGAHKRSVDVGGDGKSPRGHKSPSSAAALTAAHVIRSTTIRRLMLTNAVLSVPTLAWVFEGAMHDILHHCLLPVLSCTLPSAATGVSLSSPSGRGSVHFVKSVPPISPKHGLFSSSEVTADIGSKYQRQLSPPSTTTTTASLPTALQQKAGYNNKMLTTATTTPQPSPLSSHRSPNSISIGGGGGEQPMMSNLFLGDGGPPSRRGGGGGGGNPPRNNTTHQHTPSTQSLFLNSVSLPPIPDSDPTTPETPPLNATIPHGGGVTMSASTPLPPPPPPLLIFGVAPDAAAMDVLLSAGEEGGNYEDVVYPEVGFEVDWRRSPR